MTEEELTAIEAAYEATLHYPNVASYIVPLIAEVRRLRALHAYEGEPTVIAEGGPVVLTGETVTVQLHPPKGKSD